MLQIFFILHGYVGDDKPLQRHLEAVFKIYQAQVWFMQVIVQSSAVLACVLFCSLKTFPFTASLLLFSPPQLDDCTLQLSHNGTYLDLESSLAEQRDELEGFQQDDTG